MEIEKHLKIGTTEENILVFLFFGFNEFVKLDDFI